MSWGWTRSSLLSYMQDVADADQILSGQYISDTYSTFSAKYSSYVTNLLTMTGRAPFVIGCGCGEGQTLAQLKTMNSLIIAHALRGGVLVVHNPMNNPWTGGDYQDLTNRNLINVLDPARPEHTVLDNWLDINASWFESLRADAQAAGLVDFPILFRPWHEMTHTKGCWWDAGTHPGNPVPYQNLWAYTYDYFTDRGLDNLLWVWSAADNYIYKIYVDMEQYLPADMNQVDLLGVQVYHNTLDTSADPYTMLRTKGKLVCVPECGPLTQIDGTWDCTAITARMSDHFADCVYFLEWASWTGVKIALVDVSNADTLMTSATVIPRHRRTRPRRCGFTVTGGIIIETEGMTWTVASGDVVGHTANEIKEAIYLAAATRLDDITVTTGPNAITVNNE